MKKLAVLLILSLLLSACVKAPRLSSSRQASTASGQSTSTSSPGTSSFGPASPGSSAPGAPSSTAPRPPASSVPSEAYVVDVEGRSYTVAFNFPAGLYYQGSNIYQSENGVVPHTILNPGDENDSMFSLKVGGVYRSVIEDSQRIDDHTIALPEYDELVEYTYSDDENLPAGTFYTLGDVVVFTFQGPVDGSGQLLKTTHFYIPVEGNHYVVLWFFHNPDSQGAKAFFEAAVANVRVEAA